MILGFFRCDLRASLENGVAEKERGRKRGRGEEGGKEREGFFIQEIRAKQKEKLKKVKKDLSPLRAFTFHMTTAPIISTSLSSSSLLSLLSLFLFSNSSCSLFLPILFLFLFLSPFFFSLLPLLSPFFFSIPSSLLLLSPFLFSLHSPSQSRRRTASFATSLLGPWR